MKVTGRDHHIRVLDGWGLTTTESSSLRVTGKAIMAALTMTTTGTGTATETVIITATIIASIARPSEAIFVGLWLRL